jgi:hypothetical protein
LPIRRTPSQWFWRPMWLRNSTGAMEYDLMAVPANQPLLVA